MITEISIGLMLGIISGLISSGIILFVRSYWEKILLPWYEERIYKDAHIEGNWMGELKYPDSDSIDEYIFSLTRQSHKVTGEMISKRSGTKYTLDGEFRNMILTLTYVSTMLHAVDRGCFTFLLVRNGKVLDGQGAFYHSLKHRIVTASVTLMREGLGITNQQSTEIENSG